MTKRKLLGIIRSSKNGFAWMTTEKMADRIMAALDKEAKAPADGSLIEELKKWLYDYKYKTGINAPKLIERLEHILSKYTPATGKPVDELVETLKTLSMVLDINETWAEPLSKKITEKLAEYDAYIKALPSAPPPVEQKEQLAELADRPKIVCLCGSTRFMKEFFESGWDFTLQGYIVLSVGVCKTSDSNGAHGAEAIGQDVADKLDILHLRKIDMADEVYILNVGGYIGKSTTKELAYAIKKGKKIDYLEPHNSEKAEQAAKNYLTNLKDKGDK